MKQIVVLYQSFLQLLIPSSPVHDLGAKVSAGCKTMHEYKSLTSGKSAFSITLTKHSPRYFKMLVETQSYLKKINDKKQNSAFCYFMYLPLTIQVICNMLAYK